MMILDRLFGKRRKRKRDREQYDEEAAGIRYASLEGEAEPQTFEVPKSRSWRKSDSQYDLVELCEQMIDISREMEDTRSEYQIVTNYLNDIQTIENLTEEEKAPLIEYATQVEKLEKERTEYLKTERLLTETQYARMQAAEEELPGVIKRLEANETYLATIKKDMSYLEGEKLQWSMQKTDGKSQLGLMRKLSVYLLIIYGTLAALFVILGLVLEQNTQIPMLVCTAIAAIMGVVILVRYQDASRDIRQAEVNRNRAVSLENRVKIKYVNIKNAVDYTCEKYHTKNSRDLMKMYELYQQENREREKFRQNNDDLESYSQELVLALQERHLYDAKVWLGHANAIIDAREMVELKHELLTRRQKLRACIEANLNNLSDMKQEILQNIQKSGDNGPQVQMVLRRLEEIGASL